MSYDSHKKGLLAATVGALVLGTLVLWGTLYELSGKSNSDSQNGRLSGLSTTPLMREGPPSPARSTFGLAVAQPM